VSRHGIAYNSKNDVYIVTGPTGNDTKVYHIPPDGTPIENGSWSTVYGGTDSLPDGYPQYDPAADQVLLVRQHYAYRFRYDPESTQVEAAANPGISGIRIQANPNPFHGTVKIRFRISGSGYRNSGNCEIYDIKGTLINKSAVPGPESEITWDASHLPAGVYIIRAKTGSRTISKPIMLLR
jgi:hypothetical protein